MARERGLATGTVRDDLVPLIEKPFVPDSVNFETALQNALKYRDEFQQMQHAIDAASHQVGLAKSNFFPSVAAVFDYGIWAGNCTVTGQNEEWLDISNNLAYLNSSDGLVGVWINSTITSNRIFDNGASGIAFAACSATDRSNNTTISNNITQGNSFHGIQSDVVGSSYPNEITSIPFFD